MISRSEFLFPVQLLDLAPPEYLKMIREIGDQNRWTDGFFLVVGLLLMVPVVRFGGMRLRDPIWSRKPTVWFIAAVMPVPSGVWFAVARYLEEPMRPYRLAEAEDSNYTVVEARVIRLGVVVTGKSGYDKSRKVQWESVAPLARTIWTPRLLVSNGRSFSWTVTVPEVRLNDVACVGLDPAERLPPLFLGPMRVAR